MSRDGNGNFSLTAGNPVITGTTVSSATHNTTMSDIANALTTSIASDGQTTPTANLKMGGFKLTGLAAATVAGDAVRFEQAAMAGANSDITSLAGLTSPITGIGAGSKIQPITCTQASGALTFGLNPTALDFRSATLTTGVPNTRPVPSALSIVAPSGATLGAVTTVSAEIILLAIDNAGTVELAVINLSGGNDLSETGMISTTAISASSTAANVAYSTTARTGVPYRVVGAITAVNTAGAWGNPTLVQGYGGNALAAMSGLGYGQTWQDVKASRALTTTYYNTTGRPITISVATTNSISGTTRNLNINSANIAIASGAATDHVWFTAVVPPGASYFVSMSAGTQAITNWSELR